MKNTAKPGSRAVAAERRVLEVREDFPKEVIFKQVL